MIKKLLSLVVVVVTFALACEKQPFENIQATLVRDCTGTYLRINSKDYKVCNVAKTSGIESNTKVRASFRQTEGCKDAEEVICHLLHEYEGWIEIKRIR